MLGTRTAKLFLKSPGNIIAGATVLVIVVASILAPLIAPYDATELSIADRLTGPSQQHWFGTDQYGRDAFSRMLLGSRYTIWIGVSCVLVGLLSGATLGALAGYFGGYADLVVGRMMDILFAFPGILLGIAVVAAFGSGIGKVILAVGIVGTPRFFRIVRASTLSLKQKDYVLAADALGANHWQIIIRHIIPHALGPLIVYATLWTATTILYSAALSFLGLGVQSPTPEWGAMLSDAQPYMLEQPSLALYPGLGLSLLILSLNLLGDGLRDLLDPQTAV